MSKRREPVVERTYEPDEQACIRAFEILLKLAAGTSSGGDNGKQLEEASADGSMQR